MENQLTKRVICLWKGCDCVFEETGLFQEHLIKHGQEQMQQDLDDTQKNDDGTEKEEDNGVMAKKAKLDEGAEERKTVVFLAIEVWTDVLGFIKRIVLARRISLTNRHFHQMCWPRMHGESVEADEVYKIAIGRREQLDGSRPPTAFQIVRGQEIPLPDCPPPAYITGFSYIRIRFFDQEVLQFLTHISGRIVASGNIKIRFCLGHQNAHRRAVVDHLLRIFREGLSKTYLDYSYSMENIPLPLPEMERQICMFYYQEAIDTPILLKMLASPRADGRQWVFRLGSSTPESAQKVVDAIKQDFRAATQPLPQPFYVRLTCNDWTWAAVRLDPFEEENQRTDETLMAFEQVIEPRPGAHLRQCYFVICRHPRGEHEKWAQDASTRVTGPFGPEGASVIDMQL